MEKNLNQLKDWIIKMQKILNQLKDRIIFLLFIENDITKSLLHEEAIKKYAGWTSDVAKME